MPLDLQQRLERLRDFAAGERGPYEGIANDITLALAAFNRGMKDSARLDFADANTGRVIDAFERLPGTVRSLREAIDAAH